MTTLLPRIELESAPNPTAAVIWLHGLGADGNDFAPIVPELDLGGAGRIWPSDAALARWRQMAHEGRAGEGCVGNRITHVTLFVRGLSEVPGRLGSCRLAAIAQHHF